MRKFAPAPEHVQGLNTLAQKMFAAGVGGYFNADAKEYDALSNLTGACNWAVTPDTLPCDLAPGSPVALYDSTPWFSVSPGRAAYFVADADGEASATHGGGGVLCHGYVGDSALADPAKAGASAGATPTIAIKKGQMFTFWHDGSVAGQMRAGLG